MSAATNAPEPVAIVGMAGRFPGAETVEQFWANLVAGRECLTELDDAELLRHHEDPALIARPDYVRKRPVFTGSDEFDAALFGMTPRETELRDPQYRAMLETVHAALEHGGYDPAAYPGRIGLFAGTNINRYRYDYVERRRDVLESVGYIAVDIANNPDYLSTYIAYRLGLRGPAATVLSACSSSLVAVHMAGQAIRAGDCDMAVAGGVDIEFPFHRGYVGAAGGISATDGTLRAFDARAAGTNFGDGVGAVLLKPLSAAVRDRDTIYATIVGSATNNDGDRKVGFTAPSVAGQSECIRRAMTTAGVHPEDIDYMEAHGTGTRVGDPIEVAGLVDAYRALAGGLLPRQSVLLSSVKANIGHLGQAAGVAALIKVALALTNRAIPPSINLTTPNPEVDWDTSPFRLSTELTDWQPRPGRPRRAAVSSFGIGGTNAHAVLEEAPQPAAAAAPREREVLLWSAVDGTAEAALRERLGGYFAGLDADRFADAAYTLRVGRTPRAVRAALVAGDAAEAAAGLADPARVRTADGVSRAVVFAFPGQGAQFPAMYHRLYDDEPVFRQGCDAAFEVLHPLLGIDLRELWRTGDDETRLAATEVAQPLLYALEYTLAHCLGHWGVRARTLVGHSLGELVAAAVAGVFGFEDGLRAVAARALAMREMPAGRMLAVGADPEAVADLLSDGVVLAAVNGPGQVSLAGPAEPLHAAAAALVDRGVPIRELTTSHAFHSPDMAAAADRFEAALAELTLRPPTTAVVSAATGEPLTAEQARSPRFWATQLIEPVRFDQAAATLLREGPTTILEVGPGRTLAALLRGRPDVRATKSVVLPTEARPGRPPALEQTLAQLWVDGEPVTYWRHDASRGYRRIAVPGYPYQRRRYWVDPLSADATVRPATEEPAAPAPASAAEPETGGAPGWRLAELDWIRDRGPAGAPDLPPAAGLALLLSSDRSQPARAAGFALQRAGYRITRVAGTRRGNGSGPIAIDPADPDDWLGALDRAAERVPGPILLVHSGLLDAPAGVDLDTLDDQLHRGLESVLAALKAAAAFHRRRRRPTGVVVLGRGLVDVTGGEPVNPASAAVLGLLATAEQEQPGLRCRAVDLSGDAAERVLAGALAGDEPLLAVRGAAVWRPVLRPARPAAPAPCLRPGGTYLITGGLGGLGLVMAQALARTGLRPRLALLGRTGLDALDPDARDRATAALAAMREAGAQVEVLAADVTDPAGLAGAVQRVERRFGSVNGVVHAAGVAGGGLLERRTPDRWRAVLRPKVRGALAIEAAFAARAPLDFLLLCSSQAGLTGLYGSADYAAANAFLDAHARSRSADERRTLSVQWPGWSEVGMLARSAAGRLILGATEPAGVPTPAARPEEAGEGVALELTRTPGEDWEFDEHVFDGVPVLPGTAMLEFAVQAARAAGVPAPDAPIQLRDAVFLSPAVGDRPRRVRVLLTPVAAVHRFRIQSRGADGDGPWTDHAAGTIAAPDEPPAGDLAGLRARLSSPSAVDLAGWIRFGPRWDTTVESYDGGDGGDGGDGDGGGERLARLVLPERFAGDLAGHPLHPALLDVAAGVLIELEPGTQYAPFMYRRLTVLGPLTGDVMVHARLRAASGRGRPTDFDIYDTSTGQLLVRAEAFVMRPVRQNGFGADAEAAPAPAPVSEATPAPEVTAAPEAPTGALLSPDDGAAVFLDLLRHEHPPVVLVDRGDAPLAVRGVPWFGGAPAPVAATPVPATPVAAKPAPVQPAPAPAVRPERAEPAGSDDEIVAGLRELWRDTLGPVDVGPDDDFFDLGGNSLSAVQLTTRINQRFGVELAAGALFDATTLRTLAAEVRERRAAPANAATAGSPASA